MMTSTDQIHQKEKKRAKGLKDRQEKSIYLKFNTCIDDKSSLEKILKGVHPQITQVNLPRQKLPKFCFLVCKSKGSVEDVTRAFKAFKHEEIGHIFVKKRVTSSGPERPSKGPTKTKSKAQFEHKPKTIDPLTLVIRNVHPEKLVKRDIKRVVPKCGRVKEEPSESLRGEEIEPAGLVNFFLQFNSLGDALNSFEHLHSLTLKDPKWKDIKVQYNKI